MENQVFRHPEWKRLYDELAPTADVGKFYSYDEINLLGGIDIRSPRGRSQFIRFAKELLHKNNLWCENIRNTGYRIIEPREHGTSASRQLRLARHRVRKGIAIASHVRLEQLTHEQRAANADILARLATVEKTAKQQTKEIRKLAEAIEQKRLPSPVLDDSGRHQITPTKTATADSGDTILSETLT